MVKTILDLSAASAPVDVKRAKELFSDCPTTFRQKVKEIRAQIENGRYNRYAVIDDGRLKVNYFVYYDYCKYRRQLSDRFASKSTPPFSPQEIAEITPVSVKHHFLDGRDHP